MSARRTSFAGERWRGTCSHFLQVHGGGVGRLRTARRARACGRAPAFLARNHTAGGPLEWLAEEWDAEGRAPGERQAGRLSNLRPSLRPPWRQLSTLPGPRAPGWPPEFTAHSNLTAGCLVLQVQDECTPAGVVSAHSHEHPECAERRFPGAPCSPVWLAVPPCAETRALSCRAPKHFRAVHLSSRPGICAAGLALICARMHALS